MRLHWECLLQKPSKLCFSGEMTYPSLPSWTVKPEIVFGFTDNTIKPFFSFIHHVFSGYGSSETVVKIIIMYLIIATMTNSSSKNPLLIPHPPS